MICEPLLFSKTRRHGIIQALYALQQTVGLEPDSINHVIKELEKGRLLNRSESGKRGRRAMERNVLREFADKLMEVTKKCEEE
jgi:hypothetical protein